jgi:FkbM family methyltransferase
VHQPPDTLLASTRSGRYCIPIEFTHRQPDPAVLRGVLDPGTLDLLRERIANGGSLVHAGAFLGELLPALHAALSPGGHIWAFEPNPRSFQCARWTVGANGLSQVTLIHGGLGRASGTRDLVVEDARGHPLGGRCTFRPRHDPRQRVLSVQVLSLDEALPPGCDVRVVHLDVEGSETDALAGAMGTIARCRPLLVLERLPQRSFLREVLRPFGYRVAGRVGTHLVLRVLAPDAPRPESCLAEWRRHGGSPA